MAAEAGSPSASWYDRVVVRVPVVVAALVALGIGITVTRTTHGEPNPVRLEMAGDRATIDSIFAGQGPSLTGSVTPLKQCTTDSENSDTRSLSVSSSHTTETPAGSTSSKFEASVNTESSQKKSDSNSCPKSDAATPAPPSGEVCKDPAQRASDLCVARRHARDDVNADWWFIGLYAFAGFVVCFVGGKRARTGATRTFLYAGAAAALCAALADCVEDVCLIRALRYPRSDTWPRLMTIAATVKWSLVAIFLTAFVVGLVTLLRRRPQARDVVIPPLDRRARYDVPEQNPADHGKIGVCFSGGGIRSASFCLGVMQRLQEPDGTRPSLLSRARYLSAVSGGGYIAGAAQLHESAERARPSIDQPELADLVKRVEAAARARAVEHRHRLEAAEAVLDDDAVGFIVETAFADVAAAEVATENLAAMSDYAHAVVRYELALTEQPFMRGSAEEDHLRRHGNYLADAAGQWANAIAQLIGKLLANLVLIALAVIVAAQPLGWLGRFFLGAKQGSVDPQVGSWPSIPMYLVVAIAILAAPGLLLAVGHRGHVVRGLSRESVRAARRSGLAISMAIALGGAAGLLALTAVALPLLNSLGHWIAVLAGHPTGATAAAWPTALVAALLGRVNIKALGRETTGGGAPADPTAAKPTKSGPLQYFEKGLPELVAGPAIVVLLFAYLTAFAAQARSGGVRGAFVRLGSRAFTSWQIAIVAGAVVLGALFFIDAVNWSMHRFYKRRLWSAFTYDPKTTSERPWSYPSRLSVHAKRIEGRPELVLCGAAQTSGPDLAPPGHRAVSWSFSSEWIGGPEIGWCRTSEMEAALEKHGRLSDVTMFGAVAICGAAFGSAMGRQSMGTLNSVFAITNARLGVWLPNPRDIAAADPWKYKRHNLTYWVREIFGRYSPRGRWMLVSDGGHYENLGLVELFRRRCTQIVCVDASGDASGALTTVAQAIRLAQQELGVEFTLPSETKPAKTKAKPTTTKPGEAGDAAEKDETAPNEWDNAPGGAPLGHAPDAVAKAVADRVAKNAMTTISFTYPSEAGFAEKTQGTLVIGRAVLDPTTPLDVVSYAVGNTSFPNDSTGDQWFDADQFDDYRILGRHLGEQINTETTDW